VTLGGGLGLYLHFSNGKPLPSGSSRLVLYQTWVGHQSYTEGSRSYLTVAADTGGSDTIGYIVMNPADPVFSKAVAPGRYTIKSWQRPCDANCGNLGSVSDRCEGTFTVPANQSTPLVVLLAPGHGCKIKLRLHR